MRTIVFGFDQKKQHSRPKPMFTNKDADMASILANGACFHEVLMRVARKTSAHEGRNGERLRRLLLAVGNRQTRGSNAGSEIARDFSPGFAGGAV